MITISAENPWAPVNGLLNTFEDTSFNTCFTTTEVVELDDRNPSSRIDWRIISEMRPEFARKAWGEFVEPFYTVVD